MMICMFAGDKINSISKERFKVWLLVGFLLLYVFFWLSFDIGTNVILVLYLYCLARYIARFQPVKMGGGKTIVLYFCYCIYTCIWSIDVNKEPSNHEIIRL